MQPASCPGLEERPVWGNFAKKKLSQASEIKKGENYHVRNRCKTHT